MNHDIRQLTGTCPCQDGAPVISHDTLQLESKTAHVTWGTGEYHAMMGRACLDSGENNETGKNEKPCRPDPQISKTPASCQDFAASLLATKGSLPPLDPASLKLYSGGEYR